MSICMVGRAGVVFSIDKVIFNRANHDDTRNKGNCEFLILTTHLLMLNKIGFDAGAGARASGRHHTMAIDYCVN